MNILKISRNLFVSVCLTFLLTGSTFASPKIVTASELANISLGYDSQFVSLNGLDFHYVQKGQGQRIIFLHGYPFFAASWDNLLSHFSQSYHVVAPDNRGYGLSAKPASVEQYRIDKLVDDVKALIEHFPDQQKVILVGHDWGGTLAWTVAQKYPELISKLVVINAPPYNVFLTMLQHNPQQRKSAVYMEQLKSQGSEELFAQYGPELLWRYGFDKMLANGYLNEAFKQAFFAAWQQPGAISGALNWYRANIPALNDINDQTYWPSKTARVSAPSLLIWTENEGSFVPATLDEIPNYVDNLHIEMINDSGHTPFFDKKERVISAMETFLK